MVYIRGVYILSRIYTHVYYIPARLYLVREELKTPGASVDKYKKIQKFSIRSDGPGTCAMRVNSITESILTEDLIRFSRPHCGNTDERVISLARSSPET